MNLKNFMEKAKEILNSIMERFLHRFPEKKRRPILIGFGGLVLLFLILFPLAIHSGGSKKRVPQNAADGFSIQLDEFFTSQEPDFLPEFLLERQPRSSWSLEDIRPYWKDPGDTGLWKEQIKSAVDKLMEGVP